MFAIRLFYYKRHHVKNLDLKREDVCVCVCERKRKKVRDRTHLEFTHFNMVLIYRNSCFPVLFFHVDITTHLPVSYYTYIQLRVGGHRDAYNTPSASAKYSFSPSNR